MNPGQVTQRVTPKAIGPLSKMQGSAIFWALPTVVEAAIVCQRAPLTRNLSHTQEDYVTLPILADFIWIGGGSLGLLIVIVVIVLLLRK